MISKAQSDQQLLDGQSVVSGSQFENAPEGTHTQRRVIGNGEMVFSIQSGRQTDMGTFLSHALIAQDPQRLDQFCYRNVARSLHATSTSSRTKWRRITFGIGSTFPSPK